MGRRDLTRCILGAGYTPEFCYSGVAWPGGVTECPESAFLGFIGIIMRGKRRARFGYFRKITQSPSRADLWKPALCENLEIS